MTLRTDYATEVASPDNIHALNGFITIIKEIKQAENGVLRCIESYDFSPAQTKEVKIFIYLDLQPFLYGTEVPSPDILELFTLILY